MNITYIPKAFRNKIEEIEVDAPNNIGAILKDGYCFDGEHQTFLTEDTKKELLETVRTRVKKCNHPHCNGLT